MNESQPKTEAPKNGDGQRTSRYLDSLKTMPQVTPVVEENKKPEQLTKHQFKLFHRNGKQPKVKMLRALCFTQVPYGFRVTQISEDELKAAKIKPTKDSAGDVYVVIREEDGKLSRWPGSISFPKVASRDLGMAENWDEVNRIARSNKAPWVKSLQMGTWLIVGAVLILIFFVGFFGLFGGK